MFCTFLLIVFVPAVSNFFQNPFLLNVLCWVTVNVNFMTILTDIQFGLVCVHYSRQGRKVIVPTKMRAIATYIHMTRQNWTVEKMYCTCKPCLLSIYNVRAREVGVLVVSMHLFNLASETTIKNFWPRVGHCMAAGGRDIGLRLGVAHSIIQSLQCNGKCWIEKTPRMHTVNIQTAGQVHCSVIYKTENRYSQRTQGTDISSRYRQRE